MKNELSVVNLEDEDKYSSILVKININNRILKIEIDTGASITIMSLKIYV